MEDGYLGETGVAMVWQPSTFLSIPIDTHDPFIFSIDQFPGGIIRRHGFNGFLVEDAFIDQVEAFEGIANTARGPS
jgi:hypothetical protein